MAERETTHFSDFVDEDYIKTTVRKKDMTDKTFYKDKESSYPCLPKVHLTCSRCRTAHEDTKFWWKKPNLPIGVVNLNHFQREPQDAHLSFSAIALKVLRVRPGLQILPDIPAGSFEHSRCLVKSCLNLEFCRETLMSFCVFANLRYQKPSWKQTQLFWHLNRKIKRLKKKKSANNSTMLPGLTSWFLEAVKYFSKTENESGLPGTSPASWHTKLNRQ